MPAPAQIAVAVVGIDIGKNSFHIVGLDDCGAAKYVRPYSKGQKNDFRDAEAIAEACSGRR
jgi:transposase